MPAVFINYRTGDGDKIAALLETDLHHRFGDDEVFLARKSIKPGSRYPEELLRHVRRSDVLLAVIGPGWTSFPALHDPNDWVRREILEALDCGVPVIPVLDGHRTNRLNAADLPAELARLADRQFVRLDLPDARHGLDAIARRLTQLVPELQDRTAADPPSPADGTEPSSVRNQIGQVHGMAVQGRDFHTSTGPVITGAQGPMHLGKGDQYNNSRHVSGAGGTYVEGGHVGSISHRFGGSRADEDSDR